ncbi:aminotransferase class I/II-fold pyridoxal phosphate-dependent enzyme [Candidatus Micrarchaeota archaeon]|nr:aminotransferase class I/II-fold pyridoxal phosphate-dependent enzyme [Candidatus Micrarchaeota archaeon]MBI5176468.1 aminotransferase class I/II-fold pyridoxal phosphate-dependent enzyme [Candidatus Micrarchaeota archaeon]
MEIAYSNRFKSIPPYLFVEIEKAIAAKEARGEDVINLGIGDPDIPTPLFIRAALAKEAMDPSNHNYSSSAGEREFRSAAVDWYSKRFGVSLDAETQVCNLIGSKEGIANVARAFVNPGDTVLHPDPGYTVYKNGATLLCDGIPVAMPLLEENGFLPVFEDIPARAAKDAKLLYLNYPNNPTGAAAGEQFLKKAVDFCLGNGIILCYDNAYSEFTFDGRVAPGIMEVSGAPECAVEFISLSKTFCMTGDRCGFAAGNPKVIAGLKKIKGNIDSGSSAYLQKAAVAALSSYSSRKRPPAVEQIMAEYERRRNSFVTGLNSIGIRCTKPPSTFYLWIRLGGGAVEFCRNALEKNVVCTPGAGFGQFGREYVRFALTQNEKRLEVAVERLSEIAPLFEIHF